MVILVLFDVLFQLVTAYTNVILEVYIKEMRISFLANNPFAGENYEGHFEDDPEAR